MKKAIIRCFSLLMSMLLLASVAVAQEPLDNETGTQGIATSNDATNGFEKMLENERYELSFKSSSADIAVLDKQTGYTWFSNSQNNVETKEQLVVYYYDDNKMQLMDSYVNCLTAEDQMSWELSNNKLKVSYYIATESFSVDILPKVLTKKRMEEDILPHLTNEEQKKVLKRYKLYSRESLDEKTLESIKLNFPSIAKNDLYILSSVPSYIGEEIYKLFLKAGYTLEDLEKDCKDNNIENTYKEKPYFRVGLEYSLNNDGFLVNINTKEIEYSQNFKPFRIDVLPHFGACSAGEEGYIFVPDGSGAVINFNNGKTDVEPYEKAFFSADNALSQNETKSSAAPSVLPVFALVNKDAGFLTTVDSGFETGGIRAAVSNEESRDNYVYPYFNLFPSDTVSLSNNGMDTFILSSNEIFSSPITLSYHFTDGNATYSALALKYRNLLLEKGIIKDKNTNNTLMNIEFLSSAMVTKKFLGIPYNTLASLTTYEQASKITQELSDYKLDLTFTNALKGGKNQKYLDNLTPIRILGSKKQRKALESTVESLSVSYFAQYCQNLGKTNSSLTLSKNRARLYNYDLILRYITSKDALYLVSPAQLGKFSSKVIKSLKNNEINGVNILDMGYRLNSDFKVSAPLDRYESRVEVEKYLAALSKAVKVKAEVGSIFSLPYIEKINNIPTVSSGYLIEDEAVPFYQIAISGYVSYATEAVNVSSNAREQFLKTVELGGQLGYKWIYELPDNITNNSEEYFDCLYQNSLPKAKEFAAEYSELYQKIYNQSITEHTKLSATLSKTVWENGVFVYVNFGNEDVIVDGVTVEKNSFTYKE